MRILLPLLTRKALLSSALLAPLASVFWAPAPLPEWLLPSEKALLGEMMEHNDEGVSLRQLHETSFEAVRKAIGPDTQVVLLGEATHGSQEFYQIRADLTMALLKHGEAFDAVLFEGDFAPFSDLNHFVNGIPSSQQAMQKQQFDGTLMGLDNTASKTISDVLDGFECRFPRWMWRNNSMRDFATDVLNFNQQASVGNVEHMPVQLLGLDKYTACFGQSRKNPSLTRIKEQLCAAEAAFDLVLCDNNGTFTADDDPCSTMYIFYPDTLDNKHLPL